MTSRSPARPYRWGDYEVGEKIDHVDGMTLEEAEHQIATRLYQNTAKVHFNQHTRPRAASASASIYGGAAISLARALSFNGMNNAFHIAAINGGRHVAPLFAGDTVYAWSEVLEKAELPGRTDVGALRVAPRGGQEPGLLGFPVQERQGRVCRGRHPRSRHLARSAPLDARHNHRGRESCACRRGGYIDAVFYGQEPRRIEHGPLSAEDWPGEGM